MHNELIESCKKYMLNGGDILTPKLHLFIKENGDNKGISVPVPNKNKVREIKMSQQTKNATEIVASHSQDSLFWCFFIILNGQHEYEINSSFKREKEFKIESIEKLRSFKSELKAFKLRLSVIEDELLNQKKISIISLAALCLLHKINVLYIWDRKYFEIINNADEKINIILNKNKEDTILYDTSLETTNYYRDNYWCVENINKPLKSITGYTHKELLTIAQKLDIKDLSSKKTKKEMYEKILEKL